MFGKFSLPHSAYSINNKTLILLNSLFSLMQCLGYSNFRYVHLNDIVKCTLEWYCEESKASAVAVCGLDRRACASYTWARQYEVVKKSSIKIYQLKPRVLKLVDQLVKGAVSEIHPAKDLLILSYSWASDDIMNIKKKIGHKKLIRNVPG